MPKLITNEDYQKRLDDSFGKGVCAIIGRPKYKYSSGFLIEWNNGEVKQYKEIPKDGPPSEVLRKKKDRFKLASNIAKIANTGRKMGFRNKEGFLKRLKDALSDKAEVLDLFHCRANGTTRKRVKILWKETGEVSEHDAESICSGLKRFPPSLVQKEKEKTCIDRYGYKNPTMNRDIRLKAAKNVNKTYSIKHWKTGEVLICQGLYEYVVAEYFNENKTNFVFQKTYLLPNDKTYCLDFLISDSIPIEVKGRWYDEEAKEKWDLFKSLYPEAQLWDVSVLKKMGLYSRYLKIWKEKRNANHKTDVSGDC